MEAGKDAIHGGVYNDAANVAQAISPVKQDPVNGCFQQ